MRRDSRLHGHQLSSVHFSGRHSINGEATSFVGSDGHVKLVVGNSEQVCGKRLRVADAAANSAAVRVTAASDVLPPTSDMLVLKRVTEAGGINGGTHFELRNSDPGTGIGSTDEPRFELNLATPPNATGDLALLEFPGGRVQCRTLAVSHVLDVPDGSIAPSKVVNATSDGTLADDVAANNTAIASLQSSVTALQVSQTIQDTAIGDKQDGLDATSSITVDAVTTNSLTANYLAHPLSSTGSFSYNGPSGHAYYIFGGGNSAISINKTTPTFIPFAYTEFQDTTHFAKNSGDQLTFTLKTAGWYEVSFQIIARSDGTNAPERANPLVFIQMGLVTVNGTFSYLREFGDTDTNVYTMVSFPLRTSQANQTLKIGGIYSGRGQSGDHVYVQTYAETFSSVIYNAKSFLYLKKL